MPQTMRLDGGTLPTPVTIAMIQALIPLVGLKAVEDALQTEVLALAGRGTRAGMRIPRLSGGARSRARSTWPISSSRSWRRACASACATGGRAARSPSRRTRRSRRCARRMRALPKSPGRALVPGVRAAPHQPPRPHRGSPPCTQSRCLAPWVGVHIRQTRRSATSSSRTCAWRNRSRSR